MNVEAAHHELLKYFKSVSSNRMLMIKVFGIMIVFFVIFVVFMAWGLTLSNGQELLTENSTLVFYITVMYMQDFVLYNRHTKKCLMIIWKVLWYFVSGVESCIVSKGNDFKITIREDLRWVILWNTLAVFYTMKKCHDYIISPISIQMFIMYMLFYLYLSIFKVLLILYMYSVAHTSHLDLRVH